MNTNIQRGTTMKALFALSLLLASTLALADDSSSLRVTQVAEMERTVTATDGSKQTTLVPATLVPPGGEVVYTVKFENAGKQAATDVVVTNPVPEHTRYVANSAGGPGTEVTYSVDGGKTFGAPESLKVAAEDGTRAATAADYTHLRFRLVNALPPGQVAYARFRAVVK
jgi:uncharacterized repeat protein (TIGR01451 family)